MTTFPQNKFGGRLYNTYLELVCAGDETRLVLKGNGASGAGDARILAVYPLPGYELFRPDEDAHFTSRNGRQWRPE
jgi:hypothetical protein